MAFFTRHAVTITMDTSTLGTGTAYTTDPVNGFIHSIRYIDTSIPASAHLSVTGEVTGTPVVTLADISTASPTWYPRVDTIGTTGGYNDYTTAAAELQRVKTPVAIANERVKLEITTSTSTGLGTETGKFYILVGG
jgi:hypothetical protein